MRGSLDYERMLTAYRAHKVMLNVNSVVDSPTMLARRVFEILASGTPVVSTRSAAVEHGLGQRLAPGAVLAARVLVGVQGPVVEVPALALLRVLDEQRPVRCPCA